MRAGATMTTRHVYSGLADLVLVVHFAIVFFNVGGLALIWVGHFRRWAFVRNLTFRMAHLLAMSLVALQAVAGIECPLTVWENALRVRAGREQYSASFIEEWLGRVLFYDVSAQLLTACYVVFLAVVAVTYWRVPPRKRR